MLESYFEKFGHKCAIDLDEPFQNILENKSKLQKWFIKHAVISQNHILLRSHRRSLAALRKEMLYQMENYPYSLHPFSVLTYYFDFIWMLAVFSWLIIGPLVMFEHVYSDPVLIKNLLYVEVLLSVILIIDCIRRFFTGNIIKNKDLVEVILDYRSIAIKYLKSKFLIDLIPSIAVFFLFTFKLQRNCHLIIDFLTLLRIFRWRSMKRVIINVMRFYRFNHQVIEMFEGFISLSLIVHWVSVFSVVPGIVERRFDPKQYQWFDDVIQPNSSFMSSYLLCSHRTLGILSGRGNFMVLEKTKSENDMIYTIFVAILGHILTLIIFAKLYEIANSVGAATTQYDEMWNEISNYMKHRNLSKATQKKIKTYCAYKYQYSFFSELKLMRSLPSSLQQNITLHNSKLLLDNIGYLNALPVTSVANIVSRMGKEIVLAGDVIVRTGQKGSLMYFILSGTVAIFTHSGWEICHQVDGSEFGECAIISSEATHACTAVAIETTELYKLHSVDFYALLDYCPDVVGLMEKIATKRNNIEALIDKRFKQVYNRNLNMEKEENDANNSERLQHIWQSPEGMKT